MKKEIKVRGESIPYLLNQFVVVGKDGFLRRADPNKDNDIHLVFGICGDAFALFNMKNSTIQFGPCIICGKKGYKEK